jgi:glycosyltransferase involved in cell wall biosynthesis
MSLYGTFSVGFILDITLFINFLFSVIVLGAIGIWIYLLIVLKRSFTLSPLILKGDNFHGNDELISVIIPARNEERYIKKCVTSILDQNIDNYEVLLIDDSSTDSTWEIIQEFKENTRIRIFKAGPKPVGWIGKNWPCYIGYANSKGKYLVFTDADTVHSRDSIRDSVHTLRKEKLDVLTAVPKLKYPNLIVKLVLPILSVFMFSRYSPMRVNDPRVKIGYLFGSFFVISRECYERVGTHAAVRSEIVEDGALGKKLKEEGYKLKMFRGENLLEAFWARDFSTLWNSLKRLIIPLFFTDRTNSVLMTVGIFFLMGFPYLVILYCVLFVALNPQPDLSLYLLLSISVTCVFNIFVINYYQLKKANTHNTLYFLGAPVGCIIVSFSFLWSILTSKDNAKITWRDREYNYNNRVAI